MLQIAFQLTLAELMALLEELLLLIDEEDAVAALEQLVIDCLDLSHLARAQLVQSA